MVGAQRKTKKSIEQQKVLDEFEGLEQKIINIREGLKNQQTIKLDDIKYELDKLEAIQLYSMYDYLDVDDAEVSRAGSYFSGADDDSGVYIGARWDVVNGVAVKLEYGLEGIRESNDSVLRTQIAFGL